MALDAEAAQHTINAQIALRIAFSVPASTGVFASRQAPLLSVNSRSRVGGAHGSRGISIRGIDGTYTRATIAARIATRVVKGILDAVEKSSRCGGLALLVARKGAVTETRKFIALNAKRVAGADSLCRRAANHRQSTGGQQSKSDVTHENLSSAAAVLLIDSLRSNPSRSRGFPSTHDVAHDGGRGHGKLGRSCSRFVQQRQDTPFLLVMPGLVPQLSGSRGTKCPAGN